jgi:DNA topoisomerase IB
MWAWTITISEIYMHTKIIQMLAAKTHIKAITITSYIEEELLEYWKEELPEYKGGGGSGRSG